MKEQRSTTLRIVTVLWFVLVLLGTSITTWSQTEIGELTAAANFSAERPVPSNTAIELTLSREPTARERIAIAIGLMDVTELFTASATHYTYRADLLRLPAGSSNITVYLVSPAGDWKEIAGLPLNVQEPTSTPESPAPNATSSAGLAAANGPAADATPVSPVPNAEGTSSAPDAAAQPATEPAKAEASTTAPANETLAVKERVLKFLPSFSISLPAQPFQGNFPLDTRPSRRATFIDFDLTGSLKAEGKTGMFSFDSNFDLAGSSFKEKTLQFGTLGKDAPDVDLSSYLVNMQVGQAKFSLGHTSFGGNRHLVSGFSSRGLSLSMPLNKRFDVTAGVLNGTSVVGVRNFLGMSNIRHQVQGITLGTELLPKRPGGLRLEVSGFNGYLQGVSNVSEGSIVDAEQSRGLGLRFVTADSSGRFKLEFGFARSRFFNAQDKTLDPDGNAVPLAPVSRSAHYAETSYQLLKDIKLNKTRTLNLAVGFRYEYVEPLYRSLGASASADRFSNDLNIDASIGEIAVQVSHARANDNLAEVPSILRSLTRANRLTVAIPLAALFGVNEKNVRFYPRLGYSIDRTHNFGAGIPVNGGFEIDPTTIPDLMNINQNFSAGWQFTKFNVDYTYSRTYADNRQAAAAGNDQLGWVHTTTFSMNPFTILAFNVGLSFDSQKNFEQNTVNQTKSMNFGATWKPFKNATMGVEASQALAGDLARTSRNRNINYSGQFAYSLGREKSRFRKYGMQVFARFADAYVRTRDLVGLSNQLTRTKIVTAGLTLNIF